MKIPFLPLEIKTTSVLRTVDLANDIGEAALMGVSNGAPLHVYPRQAYAMSERNLDLGKAVGDISASVAALKKGLTDGEELDFDNPLVNLLNRPGAGSTGAQFWLNSVESFLLTNELWIVARGQFSREPLELLNIKPYDIEIDFNTTDGLPNYIRTMATRDKRFYYRQEIEGQYRYIDKAGLNEIIPVIGATSLVDDWRGRSVLAKLFYDVEMSTDGKRHNVSQLKNGMKVSAILSPSTSGAAPGQTWPADAITKLTNKLRMSNQGAGNAGNLIATNIPMQVDGLNQSNKDMDFLNLLKVSRESIYNLYSYPLPLVLSDTMTLDNYTVAQQAFYTEAVFPVYNIIAMGLYSALGPRFGLDTDKTTLSFSEADIEALRPVRVASMEKLKLSEAVSVNEIRKSGGYGPDPAGDVTLVSAGKIPLTVVADPVALPEADE